MAKSLGKIVNESWEEKGKLVRRGRHNQQNSFYHDLKMKEDIALEEDFNKFITKSNERCHQMMDGA